MNEIDVCDDVARSALALYGHISDQTPALLSMSENATYRLEGDSESWVLRVHREGYHNKNQIESELVWSQELRRAGVVETAAVRASSDGNLVELVATADGASSRHCVMFEFLEGSEPAEDAIVQHFAELGEITARMHRFSRPWTPPPRFNRLIWNFDTILGSTPHWGRWQDGQGVDGPVLSLFARAVEVIRARLEEYGTDSARFGLIHADMRLANLLVTGSATNVIDFDDCGFGWYMYDLAAALSFIEDRDDLDDAVEQWVAGYREVAPLAAADVDIIPTMIMLRRLQLVAWLASHPRADVGARLRESFTETTCDLVERYLRNHDRVG